MEEIQTHNHFKIIFPGQQIVSAFRETSITDNQENVHTVYISSEQSIDALSKYNSDICKGISVLSLKNESNGNYRANIVNSVHEVFVPITFLIGRILLNLYSIKNDILETIETTKFTLDLINEYVLTPYQSIEFFDTAISTSRSHDSHVSDNPPTTTLVSRKEDPSKSKVYLESYR
jgi:hypothetical protein